MHIVLSELNPRIKSLSFGYEIPSASSLKYFSLPVLYLSFFFLNCFFSSLL